MIILRENKKNIRLDGSPKRIWVGYMTQSTYLDFITKILKSQGEK
jgi:hypothetical protein